jgi:hypothetical protein
MQGVIAIAMTAMQHDFVGGTRTWNIFYERKNYSWLQRIIAILWIEALSLYWPTEKSNWNLLIAECLLVCSLVTSWPPTIYPLQLTHLVMLWYKDYLWISLWKRGSCILNISKLYVYLNIFNNSVPTAQKTHWVSITRNNRLMELQIIFEDTGLQNWNVFIYYFSPLVTTAAGI